MKRLGKDVAKKLVDSDYKNNRVSDPTAKLNEKQARKVKTYVKEFLDRAVHKFAAQQKQSGATEPAPADTTATTAEEPSDVDMESPASRKRKHDDGDIELPDATPPDGPDMKRLKDDAGGTATPSPPPPPPPPPEEQAELSEEQKALREQERALERENEEAQRLEDEAQRTNGEEQNRTQEVLSH